LKAEALSIAQQIRSGAYGRIPEGFEVIFAQAANSLQSSDSYQNFVRFCDDQMSKCVNGQTLTTEASSTTGTGTKALGTVHEGTMAARDRFRADALASTLNATLIKWLVDFNYADVEGYPRLRFDIEDPEDLTKEADIVLKLSNAGWEFDAEEVSEKFNWTVRKKEQKIPVVGTIGGEEKPPEPKPEEMLEEEPKQ
jgi:phage gp29-like protein